MDATANTEEKSEPKKNSTVEIVLIRSHKMADPIKYIKLNSHKPYVDITIDITCVLFIKSSFSTRSKRQPASCFKWLV